jgi:hypothetical protein
MKQLHVDIAEQSGSENQSSSSDNLKREHELLLSVVGCLLESIAGSGVVVVEGDQLDLDMKSAESLLKAIEANHK